MLSSVLRKSTGQYFRKEETELLSINKMAQVSLCGPKPSTPVGTSLPPFSSPSRGIGFVTFVFATDALKFLKNTPKFVAAGRVIRAGVPRLSSSLTDTLALPLSHASAFF